MNELWMGRARVGILSDLEQACWPRSNKELIT